MCITETDTNLQNNGYFLYTMEIDSKKPALPLFYKLLIVINNDKLPGS